jgi:AcrR family transcriptional regulator
MPGAGGFVNERISNKRMESIVNAAISLFYRKGYYATSTKDIADEVGILKGSLYYYIRSKEELLYEILVDTINAADCLVAAAIDSGTGPRERLEFALGTQIDFIMANPTAVGLFMNELRALSGRRREHLRKLMLQHEDRFSSIIRQGQGERVFIDGDPRVIALGMLGTCNYAYRWHRTQNGSDPTSVKKMLTKWLVRGLLRSAQMAN